MHAPWHLNAFLALAVILTASACSGDAPTPDVSVDVSTARDLPPNVPHGRVCDNPGGLCKDKVNGDPLFCIGTQAGKATGRGFCALECKPNYPIACIGTPNGTLAKCILTGVAAVDGGTAPSYCAFLCASAGRHYSCPPTMECDPHPSAGGNIQCIPRAK